MGEASWGTTVGVITNSPNREAHVRAWKAWLCGFGQTHTDTLSQTVSIASTASSATVSFWLHVDTGGGPGTAFDTLRVQVRDAAGAVVPTTLANYSNLQGASGYSLKTFDVTSFRGQTVRVYFEGAEDSSLQTSFVIDDCTLAVQ